VYFISLTEWSRYETWLPNTVILKSPPAPPNLDPILISGRVYWEVTSIHLVRYNFCLEEQYSVCNQSINVKTDNEVLTDSDQSFLVTAEDWHQKTPKNQPSFSWCRNAEEVEHGDMLDKLTQTHASRVGAYWNWSKNKNDKWLNHKMQNDFATYDIQVNWNSFSNITCHIIEVTTSKNHALRGFWSNCINYQVITTFC